MRAGVIMILIFAAAFFTNPDRRDHQDAIRAALAVSVDIDPNNALFDVVASYGIKRLLFYEDYHLFSIGRVDGVIISFGIYKKVFIFTKNLKP
jgi:hypothetical protein